MQYVWVLVALIGVALAAPQGNEDSQVIEAPKFNTLAQEKIIELYEFLKTEFENKNEIMILAAFLGVSLAVPKDENTQMEEVPEYSPMTQDKIIELYEFLKSELEGVDIDVLEPEMIVDQTLRQKRSAEASPFFLRHLFRNLRRHNNYGYHHDNHGYGHHNYHGHGYGHRNHYGRASSMSITMMTSVSEKPTPEEGFGLGASFLTSGFIRVKLQGFHIEFHGFHLIKVISFQLSLKELVEFHDLGLVEISSSISTAKSKITTTKSKQTTEEERAGLGRSLIAEDHFVLVQGSQFTTILALKFGLEELVQLNDRLLGQGVVLGSLHYLGVLIISD
eukprot:TCALIF_12346-PA protein Name:"Protein of unknown function" AED:0.54 eAED:0.54 QI:99/0.25/0.2/0.4/1/0.8/5/0/333